MDISNYNIEQCDAVSVLNAIMDMHDHPQDIMAIKQMAQSVLAKIGTPASGQPTDLFAAIAAGGGEGGGDAQESTSQAILVKVQQIIDAHILDGYSVGGVVFIEGVSPQTTSEAILNIGNIKKIVDNSILVNLNGSHLFENNTNLEEVELSGVSSLGSITAAGSNKIYCYAFNGCSSLKKAKFANATSIFFASSNDQTVSFSNCTSLEELVIPNVTLFYIRPINNNYKLGNNSLKLLDLRNCPEFSLDSNSDAAALACLGTNLIDLIIGAGFRSNQNLKYWYPSNALLTDNRGLVTDDEDEFGNAITNNLQQFLYNIRRHIAALLPTDVGNKTITLHASIKAAILADANTLAAFPSNWTIA